jgi:Iron-binding zinc finger CDGSH type
VRAMFLSQVHNCPAGRLLAFDKAAGRTIEQHSPLAIGLIEDPVEDCSGPIWLRGGVVLTSADGHQYEKCNNMTVCRCGASKREDSGSPANRHPTSDSSPQSPSTDSP